MRELEQRAQRVPDCPAPLTDRDAREGVSVQFE